MRQTLILICSLILASCSYAATPTLKFAAGKQSISVGKKDIACLRVAFSKDDSTTDTISLRLTQAAGQRLHTLTSNNIKKAMTISYDGTKISSATIQTPVGASLEIAGVKPKISEEIKKGFNAKECKIG